MPEQLLMNKPYFSLDTGAPPLNIMTNDKDVWKKIFFKRKRFQLDHKEMKTLALRETETGNKLTVDKDSDRLKLAKSVTEIEREWMLFESKLLQTSSSTGQNTCCVCIIS